MYYRKKCCRENITNKEKFADLIAESNDEIKIIGIDDEDEYAFFTSFKKKIWNGDVKISKRRNRNLKKTI